ncbi:MAG: hypothetical protein K2J80_13725 [Oscillospiraceae bacterium]|nr:hypothetical protein [Oscillospiraceae bacterium]
MRDALISPGGDLTRYSDMTSALLLSRFPELTERINAELDLDGLPHCLFEQVLTPVLREYFDDCDFSGVKTNRQKKSALKNADPLVLRIFEFYEELAASGDEEVRNLLQVSLLEPLYDNKRSYAGARLFIGGKTWGLFESCAEYLNIPKGEME